MIHHREFYHIPSYTGYAIDMHIFVMLFVVVLVINVSAIVVTPEIMEKSLGT